MSAIVRPPSTARLQGPLLKWADALTEEDGAETLDLNGRGASDKVLTALGRWPGLAKVRHLDLSGNRFAGDALPAMLEVVAPRLETLDLSGNPRLREQGFKNLGDQRWPALRVLRLRQTKLRKGLAVLEKLDAPALEVLDAFDAGFGAAGAKALAGSSIIGQLKVLEFENGDPGLSGFEALKRVLPSTGLEQLGLGRRHIDAALLEALLDGPIRQSLRALSLENDEPATLAPLDGMGLVSLKVAGATFHALPRLPALRRLVTCYTGSRVKAPLPAPLMEQLEYLRCTFFGDDDKCGLVALAKTASRLRVLDITGGSAAGWAALAHARFVPYLEAMRVETGFPGSAMREHMPEIANRAESVHTIRLGHALDPEGLALRWCQHLDIERVVTPVDFLDALGETGLRESPLLQNAALVYLSGDGKVPGHVLKTLGHRARFSSGEPLDVLAGLDFIR